MRKHQIMQLQSNNAQLKIENENLQKLNNTLNEQNSQLKDNLLFSDEKLKILEEEIAELKVKLVATKVELKKTENKGKIEFNIKMEVDENFIDLTSDNDDDCVAFENDQNSSNSMDARFYQNNQCEPSTSSSHKCNYLII